MLSIAFALTIAFVANTNINSVHGQPAAAPEPDSASPQPMSPPADDGDAAERPPADAAECAKLSKPYVDELKACLAKEADFEEDARHERCTVCCLHKVCFCGCEC